MTTHRGVGEVKPVNCICSAHAWLSRLSRHYGGVDQQCKAAGIRHLYLSLGRSADLLARRFMISCHARRAASRNQGHIPNFCYKLDCEWHNPRMGQRKSPIRRILRWMCAA
ncbi:MAG: hypothetical protein WBC13_15305, partial [Dokdonella sp.]